MSLFLSKMCRISSPGLSLKDCNLSPPAAVKTQTKKTNGYRHSKFIPAPAGRRSLSLSLSLHSNVN